MPVSRKSKRKKKTSAVAAKKPGAFQVAASELISRVRTRFRVRPRFYLAVGATIAASAIAIGAGVHSYRASQRLCVVPNDTVLPTGQIFSGAVGFGLNGADRAYSREQIIGNLNLNLVAVLGKDSGEVFDARKLHVGELAAGEIYVDGRKIRHAQFTGDVQVTVLDQRITVKSSDRFILSDDAKTVRFGRHSFAFAKLVDEVSSKTLYTVGVPPGRIKIHSVAMAHKCE